MKFVKACLVFAVVGTLAVSTVTLVGDTVAALANSPAPAPKTYVEHWNTCVLSLKAEFPEIGWGDWQWLQESYQNEPPTMVKSLDRVGKLKTLLTLEQQRTKALEALIKIEEGR